MIRHKDGLKACSDKERKRLPKESEDNAMVRFFEGTDDPSPVAVVEADNVREFVSSFRLLIKSSEKNKAKIRKSVKMAANWIRSCGLPSQKRDMQLLIEEANVNVQKKRKIIQEEDEAEQKQPSGKKVKRCASAIKSCPAVNQTTETESESFEDEHERDRERETVNTTNRKKQPFKVNEVKDEPSNKKIKREITPTVTEEEEIIDEGMELEVEEEIISEGEAADDTDLQRGNAKQEILPVKTKTEALPMRNNDTHVKDDPSTGTSASDLRQTSAQNSTNQPSHESKKSPQTQLQAGNAETPNVTPQIEQREKGVPQKTQSQVAPKRAVRFADDVIVDGSKSAPLRVEEKTIKQGKEKRNSEIHQVKGAVEKPAADVQLGKDEVTAQRSENKTKETGQVGAAQVKSIELKELAQVMERKDFVMSNAAVVNDVPTQNVMKCEKVAVAMEPTDTEKTKKSPTVPEALEVVPEKREIESFDTAKEKSAVHKENAEHVRSTEKKDVAIQDANKKPNVMVEVIGRMEKKEPTQDMCNENEEERNLPRSESKNTNDAETQKKKLQNDSKSTMQKESWNVNSTTEKKDEDVSNNKDDSRNSLEANPMPETKKVNGPDVRKQDLKKNATNTEQEASLEVNEKTEEKDEAMQDVHNVKDESRTSLQQGTAMETENVNESAKLKVDSEKSAKTAVQETNLEVNRETEEKTKSKNAKEANSKKEKLLIDWKSTMKEENLDVNSNSEKNDEAMQDVGNTKDYMRDSSKLDTVAETKKTKEAETQKRELENLVKEVPVSEAESAVKKICAKMVDDIMQTPSTPEKKNCIQDATQNKSEAVNIVEKNGNVNSTSSTALVEGKSVSEQKTQHTLHGETAKKNTRESAAVHPKKAALKLAAVAEIVAENDNSANSKKEKKSTEDENTSQELKHAVKKKQKEDVSIGWDQDVQIVHSNETKEAPHDASKEPRLHEAVAGSEKGARTPPNPIPAIEQKQDEPEPEQEVVQVDADEKKPKVGEIINLIN